MLRRGLDRVCSVTPLQAVPPVWFGVVEQLVALCLIIAQGLTFLSFGCAILFAFFRRTEPVAMAVAVVMLVMMLTLLVSGLKAIWSAFNRLFEAFGHASRGVFVTPGQATATVLAAGGAIISGGAPNCPATSPTQALLAPSSGSHAGLMYQMQCTGAEDVAPTPEHCRGHLQAGGRCERRGEGITSRPLRAIL